MAASAVLILTPLSEPVSGECPACYFEALIYLRVYHLTPAGVTLVGERITCGRCAAERRRERGDM